MINTDHCSGGFVVGISGALSVIRISSLLPYIGPVRTNTLLFLLWRIRRILNLTEF